jgi:hypothetical protein
MKWENYFLLSQENREKRVDLPFFMGAWTGGRGESGGAARSFFPLPVFCIETALEKDLETAG